MMKKMKIAVIGNGKGANRYHIPFILNRPETLELAAIYARHLNKGDWKRIDGVRYTDDLDSILNDPEIDLIDISTPLSTHYPLAKQALEAGKNVVVDKPFVETLDQAEELFELAEKKGVLLACYQNRRYDSDFLTVQKVLEDGKLGDLFEVEMCYDYDRPEVPDQAKGFSRNDSFLFGHGSHTFDQAIRLFGKPDRVVYDVRQLNGKGRMNDYFDVDLFYGPLKVSVKSSYYRVDRRPRFTLTGRNGSFVKLSEDRQEEFLKRFEMPDTPGFGTDRPEDYGILSLRGEEPEAIVSEQGDYSRVYDDLYNAVMLGQPLKVRPEQTLAVMEILENGIQPLEEQEAPDRQ